MRAATGFPLLTLAAQLSLAGPAAADLTVTVAGIRSPQGQVKLMLFDREDGFRKEAKARQVLALPARAGTLSAGFPALPAGRYAVIAYHDEDGNGKLNLRFGMIPVEGYGLSNNPEVSGPPKFSDAAFEVPVQGGAITIRLDY